MMILMDASLLGDRIRGVIYGDERGRFNDGEYIITSRIIETLPDNVYRTLNSTYKVEFATEPKKAAGDFFLLPLLESVAA